MASSARLSFTLSVLVWALAAPTLAESNGLQTAADEQRASFVRGYLSGVWLLTLDLPDEDAQICPGNQLLPETVRILGNFTQSGEFLSSSDLPALQVPAIDPSTGLPVLDENGDPVVYSFDVGFGHGLWRKTPRGGFFLEAWRLAKLEGEAVGIAKGESSAELDRSGRQLTGDIRLQLSLADGVVLPPACGSLVGVKLSD